MTSSPPARRRLLLVHAHPDDETLATGGTMAHYAAQPDTSVTLVTCTLGEQGEVIPDELAELAPERADQLGGYRIGELAAACAALGVTDHRFLGGAGRWRDSGMALAGHGVRAALPARLHPRAFARPEAFDAQVDALVDVLAEVRPQVVLSYAADGGYGHPDHVRAHDITLAALARVPARRGAVVHGRATLDAGLAALAGAPGLPFRHPEPDELPSVPDAEITVRLDVSGYRAARVAALRAHATQVLVWSGAGKPGAAGAGTGGPGSDGPGLNGPGSNGPGSNGPGSNGPGSNGSSRLAFAVSNRVAQPFLDVEEYVVAEVPQGTTDLFAGLAP